MSERRDKCFCMFLVITILIFFHISVLNAQVSCELFVNGTNTGIVDGSLAHPYTTIGQAMDVAQPGCYIYVSPGDYYESVTFKHSGIKLRTLDPIHPENTRIHGAVFIDWLDGCSIAGFTIMNSCKSGVVCNGTYPVIKGCIIRNNRHDGISIFDGGMPLIMNCVIWGNGHWGVGSDS